MYHRGESTIKCRGQVLERILAVDFRFPKSIPVSAECKDLLTRILVADPAKRASIEEIQTHPWCARATALRSWGTRQTRGPVLQGRS